MDDQPTNADQAPRRGLKVATYTAELHIEATEAEETLDRLTGKAGRLRNLLGFGVTPWRVLVDVLVVALLAALVFAQYGCASRVPFGPVPVVSTATEQTRAALMVETICGTSGSGVIIDTAHALTAAHVIAACPMPVLLTDSSGRRRVATPEAVVDVDVVRLQLLPGQALFTDARPPTITRPSPGAAVCIESGRHHQRRCGKVRAVEPGRGGIRHSATTTKGDSGSGLYDGSGRLVGIVITCDTEHDGDDVCNAAGGGATPLWPRAWIAAGGGS